jgi:hypothetical protein
LGLVFGLGDDLAHRAGIGIAVSIAHVATIHPHQVHTPIIREFAARWKAHSRRGRAPAPLISSMVRESPAAKGRAVLKRRVTRAGTRRSSAKPVPPGPTLCRLEFLD